MRDWAFLFRLWLGRFYCNMFCLWPKYWGWCPGEIWTPTRVTLLICDSPSFDDMYETIELVEIDRE